MCLMIRQLGCFFKKPQMLRIKFFLIRSFSNSALEASDLLDPSGRFHLAVSQQI